MTDPTRMQRAIEIANEAAKADRDGKYQEALDLYKSCLDNWMLIYKYEKNPSLKPRLEAKMNEYITRAEKLKEFLKKPQEEDQGYV